MVFKQVIISTENSVTLSNCQIVTGFKICSAQTSELLTRYTVHVMFPGNS